MLQTANPSLPDFAKARDFIGAVLWRGPSELDGQPVVVIANSFGGSVNVKTGEMTQVYILRDDMPPSLAAQTGADASICGTCPHRGTYKDGLLESGTRTCYVLLHHGPRSTYDTYKRGRYVDVAGSAATGRALLAGRIVRIGAYGDPAAVPAWLWDEWLADAEAVTGYTHQWRTRPELARWAMASCDTVSERDEARAMGFRTFRVAPRLGWSKQPGEVLCAASAEAGKRTTCIACKACGGHSSKARADILIPAHGNGAAKITG